jgi:DNA-binding NarL/FixJ family response regulator
MERASLASPRTLLAPPSAEAVAQVRQHHPDVVLMDVRTITTHPDTAAVRVLILATFDLDDYVYRALRAGASGFLAGQ